MLALELVHEVVHHPVVKVFTAKMGVTGRGLHLKHTRPVDAQQRDIKGATAQIVDQHRTVLGAPTVLLVETVRNSGGSRLVDNSQHVQACDLTGILGRKALRVVEARWHSDDRVLHLLPDVRLGNLLHLGEHHCRNLLGHEKLLLALVQDLNLRLVIFGAHHLEREVLDVGLH
mmetsp:Transcript_9368/g.24809  ORF Transcript_9368/g.24809 Transcript_9368/m.24809 type:complete len:173 (-) Transcript_9368:295-813(-)